MLCKRSQRDPVGDIAGDDPIFGAEGDLVILLGKRLITRFSGLMDGEREGFSVVMDFQQRAFAYPGALVMNRIGVPGRHRRAVRPGCRWSNVRAGCCRHEGPCHR